MKNIRCRKVCPLLVAVGFLGFAVDALAMLKISFDDTPLSRNQLILLAILLGLAVVLAVLTLIRLQRTARRLREVEARWNFALEGSAQGVWDRDILNATTYYSPRLRRMLGYDDQDFGTSDREWSARIHPDDVQRINTSLAAYLAAPQQFYAAEFRLRHRDGHYLWVQSRGQVMELTADGRPRRMIGTLTDISGRRVIEEENRRLSNQLEQKVAERTAQLDQALIRLKLATEAAGVGIWTWTLSTNRLDWDERMCEIYELSEGSRKSGLYYDYWRACIHPDDRERAEAALDQALRTHRSFDTVFRIVLPGGRIRYIQPASVVNLAPDGTPLGMVGINRDITRQREQEARLVSAKERAETASIIKSRFLANMGHEICTPLNLMIGLSSKLLESELSRHQRDYLEKIQDAGIRLQGLLNDLLDYSRIEAGLLVLEPARLRLAEILENTRAAFDAQAGEKKIGLRLERSPDLPEVLVGDVQRLQQIINNLAANAIRFTDHGSIDMSFNCLEKSPDSVLLKVAVSAAGIGISFEQIARMLSVFQQADDLITHKYGVTSLRLTIARRLAEMMGGEVGAERLAGGGDVFWFTAVLGVPAEAPLPAEAPAAALPLADMEALRPQLEALERLLEIGQARAIAKCDEIEDQLQGTCQQAPYARVVRAVARFDFDGALEHLRALMKPENRS